MKFSIPEEIIQITNKLAESGFDAYLVGGCVRDLIRGKEPKDWDVTTNATPEQIQDIFGEDETFYENDYGTVGVKTESEDPSLAVVEATPYRVESGYSDSRRPDEVRFAETLAEDLERRDFTMNAIAYTPQKDEVVDLHGGRDDIVHKTIKTVGESKERFAEDALRMMRAVRLSAELDFTIDPKTLQGIAENAHMLEKISQERVRDEFVRIVMSDTPMQALYISQKVGLLKYILPELEDGIGCEQGGAHSFDVFEHNLRTLQHAADKNYPLEVRIAALFHDISKPVSRRKKGDRYTFYGHEVVGARTTKGVMKRMHFSKDVANKTEKLVRWHMFFADPDKVTLSAARRMVARVGEEDVWDLLNLRICDRIGTGRPKEQPFRFRKYKSMVEEALRSPVSVSQLKIDGSRIMEITKEHPGPKVGWTLHALLEEVLDDPDKNTEEYLEKRALELFALPQEELKELGEKGKERRDEEDEKEIEGLRRKYHVQ